MRLQSDSWSPAQDLQESFACLDSSRSFCCARVAVPVCTRGCFRYCLRNWFPLLPKLVPVTPRTHYTTRRFMKVVASHRYELSLGLQSQNQQRNFQRIHKLVPLRYCAEHDWQCSSACIPDVGACVLQVYSPRCAASL